MSGQEITALTIVLLTVVAFVWNRFRPRKFSFSRNTHCGCAAQDQWMPRHSIVFHARRGERPQVRVKM